MTQFTFQPGVTYHADLILSDAELSTTNEEFAARLTFGNALNTSISGAGARREVTWTVNRPGPVELPDYVRNLSVVSPAAPAPAKSKNKNILYIAAAAAVVIVVVLLLLS